VRKKRTAAFLLLAVIFAVGLWIFRDNSLHYRLENSQRTEGVQYIPNFLNAQAFVSGFDWDGAAEKISVVIPGTVEFYNSSRTFRVTKLGGFFGRDVPCAFGPMLPVGSGGGQLICPESNELETAQEEHPNAPVRDLTVICPWGGISPKFRCLPLSCSIGSRKETAPSGA